MTIAAAARELVIANGTRINPTGARRRQSDVVPRAGLPDGTRLGAKLHCVATGQAPHMQPEMNHFMLEDFTQRERRRITEHAAHFVFGGKEGVDAKRVHEQWHRQLDCLLPHINIARGSRELAAPRDAAGRQAALEVSGVQLGIEGL